MAPQLTTMKLEVLVLHGDPKRELAVLPTLGTGRALQLALSDNSSAVISVMPINKARSFRER